ncbi:MAG: DNA-directed RNA polymerase subunit omega [Phycisphaerae bacterium]|jgi:DNA-directed RNA polymerase subunit omega
MIETLKYDEISNKVGGSFKLSVLIQKRMKEIMEGARPLVEDTRGKTLMEIVVQEIMEDKITFEMEAE